MIHKYFVCIFELLKGLKFLKNMDLFSESLNWTNKVGVEALFIMINHLKNCNNPHFHENKY